MLLGAGVERPGGGLDGQCRSSDGSRTPRSTLGQNKEDT